jgi:hypothetical protein
MAGTRSLGRGPPSPPDHCGQCAPRPGELAGTPGSKCGARTATEPAAQAPYPDIDAQADLESINATAVAATARASSAWTDSSWQAPHGLLAAHARTHRLTQVRPSEAGKPCSSADRLEGSQAPTLRIQALPVTPSQPTNASAHLRELACKRVGRWALRMKEDLRRTDQAEAGDQRVLDAHLEARGRTLIGLSGGRRRITASS